MPELGKADIAIFNTVTEYGDGMIGVDVILGEDFLRQSEGEAEIFIEVVSKLESLQQRNYFVCPSREVSVQINSLEYFQGEKGLK